MDSAAAGAGGKENIGSTTAKPIRRGVGPRSGTKSSTPLPHAPTPSHAVSAAAPNLTFKSRRKAAVPAPSRCSSRVKVHTPNPGCINNASAVLATAASVRLDPGASATPGNKGKKTRQRLSKPVVLPLPSASSVPPCGASSAEGTSAGGGGGGGGGVRENKRGTAKRSGRGVTRQAKKQPRRGASAKKSKANDKQGGTTTTGPGPAGLTSDPAVRLSRQSRSDFDFNLTDDEIDTGDSRSTESKRRTSATPGASRPGRKRARDGDDAGVKRSLRAKQARNSSGRVGRNPEEELASAQAAASLRGSGGKSPATASKDVRRSSKPAANQATSCPRSTSSVSGRGSDGALSSPRGSWHLGALFGESDDDDDDRKGVEGENGDNGDREACNWRLSDDENEDEHEVVDLPKRKQRRSARSSGTVATTTAGSGKKEEKKKGRASGRGGGADARGGSRTRSSTGSGSGGSGSGGSGGGEGEDEGGIEATKSGWADRFPSPAFIEGKGYSGAGSGSQSAADQAVLEVLKAQYKKVDSHELRISS
eukprot:g8151.t1